MKNQQEIGSDQNILSRRQQNLNSGKFLPLAERIVFYQTKYLPGLTSQTFKSSLQCKEPRKKIWERE